MGNNTVILPDGTTLTAGLGGYYKCPHNMFCQCKTPNCAKCGWHPDVITKRREELQQTKGENQRIGGPRTRRRAALWKIG